MARGVFRATAIGRLTEMMTCQCFCLEASKECDVVLRRGGEAFDATTIAAPLKEIVSLDPLDSVSKSAIARAWHANHEQLDAFLRDSVADYNRYVTRAQRVKVLLKRALRHAMEDQNRHFLSEHILKSLDPDALLKRIWSATKSFVDSYKPPVKPVKQGNRARLLNDCY